MSPTLADIAKATGTSVSTVSRVLAGGTVARRISQATRERVIEAASRAGYRPNLIARTLRTRRSHTCAFLISDIANPFFAQIGSLVEQTLHKHGYSLMLCNSGEDPDREAEYLQLLSQKAIDGLILVPVARNGHRLRENLPANLPLVILDRPVDGEEPAVFSDQDQSTHILCDELDRMGVKRIVLVSGPKSVVTHQRRSKLVAERFEVLGEVEGPPQIQTGREAMEKYGHLKPEAFVCTNNFLGQGVIEATMEAEHAPIIGVFDEIPMMHLIPVPIVASCQDIPALADGCVQQLLGQLSNGDGKPKPIVLTAHLVTNRAYDARRARR